jgi:hypothetical protein
VRNDFEREAELARVAAFDHTMRFAYGVNAAQGNDPTPSVQYWRGRNGEVDYVFEIGETPVPIGLAYRSRDRDAALAAVREFQDTYDAPVGFLLAGDTVRDSESTTGSFSCRTGCISCSAKYLAHVCQIDRDRVQLTVRTAHTRRCAQ